MYTTQIDIERDDCMGEPWKEHDGHGIVSDWTKRDKAPGERVLCEDRSYKRFYDFAASIEIAKRDGWDAHPYGTGTKGERAARAVESDYQHLRAWCNDEWRWVCVLVKVCRDGELVGTDSLGGIDDAKYAQEEGERMAQELIAQDRKARRQARKNVLTALCYG